MPSLPIRAIASTLVLGVIFGVGAADQSSPQYFVVSGKLTADGRVLAEPATVLQVNQTGTVAVTDGRGNPSWRVVMTVSGSQQTDSLSWHTQILETVDGAWRLLSERILAFKANERPAFTGESESRRLDAVIKYEFSLQPHRGDQPPAPPGFEG